VSERAGQLLSGAGTAEGDELSSRLRRWRQSRSELHPRKARRRGERLELAGWPYPRHLVGRLFAAVVHGDTIGAETVRRALIDWASDMHLIAVEAALPHC